VYRRATERITNSETNNVYAALNFAAGTLRAEPNLHVTVHWAQVAGDMDPPTRIARLRARMGAWLRRRGLVPVWVYAREVASSKGEHLHLWVHVPPAMIGTKSGQAELERLFEGWVAIDGELDNRPRSRAVKAQPVVAPFQRRNMRAYILKEADPTALEHLGIETKYTAKASGGVVLGKRVKVSQSIDYGARRAYFDSLGPRQAGDEHWLDDIDPARKAQKPRHDGQGPLSATYIPENRGWAATAKPGASGGPSKVDPDR
jgi:hypothetical protein